MIDRYGWHEWLVKTNFSFLIGASHPEEVIASAIEKQYRSIAINDFDGVYGLARSFREVKYLENTLQLHYGAEFHIGPDQSLPVLLRQTLVLIAQNRDGYRTICHLSSLAHRDGKHHPHLTWEMLLESHLPGVVAIIPMRGWIRVGDSFEWLEKLRDHLKNRLYMAISRHLHNSEDFWIRPTFEIAKKFGCPILFCQDAFFHGRSKKSLSDTLSAIRTNLTIEQATGHFFPNDERYLHSLPALDRLYRDLPGYQQALQTSMELAEQCQFSFTELRYCYPQEMIPSGHSAHSYLEKLTWSGANHCYGKVLSESLIELLKRELRLINELEFADYFLTVWDIVHWARKQEIICQGRGSAANSAVCFVLGITSVDPTKFDLLFERFISMERGDPPDIDVDFEHERREEVIQYIYTRYGRQRAAMVANVITFRRKGALRAIGKAFSVPEVILKKVSDLCSSKYHRSQELPEQITTAREHFSKKKSPVPGQAVPWEIWQQLADELTGFPRHLGIHSGGFMLNHEPLTNLVAIEPATMTDRSVVQWCKEDIEALGFFKIDILALGMLTAVRKCFQLIQHHYGVCLSMTNIPQEDADTYRMIQRADTVGVFQIESRAQMSMLPRLKPKTFYDLVIEIAIIRPGPIQGKVIHPYLERREGIKPITFPDEKLRPILERTLGIAIFQEQAMRIAIAVGDFTPGEANELRKNIGSWGIKDQERNLNPWLIKLEEGMRSNGYQEEFVEQINGQMKGFADYGFPESHAVSFALIAYVSCYLKCHYPAAFFAAVLNSQPMGFYSPHALLQAAGRDGVKILPACIQNSEVDNQLEQVQEGFALRLGFRQINALRVKAADRVVTLRHRYGGKFGSLAEILQDQELFKPDLTALAFANCFRCFDLSRNNALWLVAAAPWRIWESAEDPLTWREESYWQRLNRDFAAFNTSLGEHPCAVIKRDSWNFNIPVSRLTESPQLTRCPANAMVVIFGLVLVRQAPPSAKGMVFLTLEDEYGFINLAFSPPTYAKLHSSVESRAFLCAKGKLQKAGSYHSILINQVYEQEEIVSQLVESRDF